METPEPFSTAEILDPDVTIKTRGGDVVVRELAWTKARKFVGRIVELSMQMVKERGADNLTEVDGIRLVTDHLADEMVLLATGREKDWLETVTLTDFTRLLDAAIKLNFRPELIEAGKGLAATFAGVLATATGSPKPTTTSSRRAIASRA